MTAVAFDGKDQLEVKKRTHYDKVFEKVTIIPLFYVGVFCFVNGKLDVFVFLSCIFVRLSFPFRGVLRNPAVVWIGDEENKLFSNVGFNYGLFSYNGRKIYVESGVW